MLSFVLTSLILGDVTAYLPVVKDAYAYLHANPELGQSEVKAHAYIEKRLRELGYTQFVASTSAPTAVIAVLDSKRPGPVIALRAEMDARPVEGRGVMHTCGHDVHTAILLGTAAMLIHETGTLHGKVVFVFQPAEETPGGADDLVNEKILAKLGVTSVFAEHATAALPVGTVAVAPGPALASSSYFTLTLEPRLITRFVGTVDTTPRRVMYSEDFGYYAPTFETLYLSLGIAKDGLGLVDVHQPDFSVHPDAFVYGLSLMHDIAQLASDPVNAR